MHTFPVSVAPVHADARLQDADHTLGNAPEQLLNISTASPRRQRRAWVSPMNYVVLPTREAATNGTRVSRETCITRCRHFNETPGQRLYLCQKAVVRCGVTKHRLQHIHHRSRANARQQTGRSESRCAVGRSSCSVARTLISVPTGRASAHPAAP